MLLAMVLMTGCSFGPRQMEYGRLAYNEAVRASSDQELLLNIVRLRYLDTIEFLSANAISAQLSLSVAVGGSVGRDAGTSINLGFGEAAWSNRPTFTFTPQRGVEFAKTVIAPVPLPVLIELVSADWDVSVLFRLLVQNVNGLTNLSGIVSDEFVEFAELMGRMQARADLYFGSVEHHAQLSDPIPVSQVSGSDLVEAAKAGYRFSRDASGDTFVLTAKRKQLAMHIPLDAAERSRIIELLRLDTGNTEYIMIQTGTQPEDNKEATGNITVDTRSALDAIAYLSGGVEVPLSHIEKGWAVPEWPVPGSRSDGLSGFFQIHSSSERPASTLSVRYRDHWFYLADNDTASRLTFLSLAEILRMALSPVGDRQTPVLTLPVGGR